MSVSFDLLIGFCYIITETTKKTLPPVHARRGSAGMPATVKSAPKTLSEATGEAKKYLRFYAR